MGPDSPTTPRFSELASQVGEAVDLLRGEIKLGNDGEIVRWANAAADTVFRLAESSSHSVEHDQLTSKLRVGVAKCMASTWRAYGEADSQAVISRGELVGDAVANLRLFLIGLN